MNKPRVEHKYIDWALYIKCIECLEYKEANYNNFSKDKSLTYGLSHKCKDCKKKYNSKYYKAKKDTIKENNKKWREDNVNRIKEQKKEYYKNNKAKIDNRIKNYRRTQSKELWYNRTHFHNKTDEYIKMYNLRPTTCPICWSNWLIHVHHPSYETPDKWCEVVFCCASCHKNIHCWNIECPMPINLLSLKDESELEDFLLKSIELFGNSERLD